MVPAGTAHARCAGETGCPLHGAIAIAPDPNSEPKPEERKRKKEKPALSRWALVPFDVLRPRAPLLDVTAGEGQDPLVRGQPWRWGRARRRSKGAAQRALVCTSMEREVLPKMAPILEENVLPAASCWASRPAEMERHQTEPVPWWTRAGRCWGLWSNSGTMAWIIHLPLEPGEALYACQTSARHVQR